MASRRRKPPDASASVPVVVFYDCCIPQRQFKRFVRSTVLFATHLFCFQEFPEDVYKNDSRLFAHVELKRAAEYPDALCIFLTYDGGFVKHDQVKHHPAFNTTVKVIVLESKAERNENWRLAREFVHTLCDMYMDSLEAELRKSRRRTRAA